MRRRRHIIILNQYVNCINFVTFYAEVSRSVWTSCEIL